MASNEGTTANRSFCKICSENGHPGVPLYWSQQGQKGDSSPKWIPFKDQACTVRHVHKHLEPQSAEEESVRNATVESTTTASSSADLIREQAIQLAVYPSDSEIKDALTTAYELSQKQSTLLKNLLESLEYVPEDNS